MTDEYTLWKVCTLALQGLSRTVKRRTSPQAALSLAAWQAQHGLLCRLKGLTQLVPRHIPFVAQAPGLGLEQTHQMSAGP